MKDLIEKLQCATGPDAELDVRLVAVDCDWTILEACEGEFIRFRQLDGREFMARCCDGRYGGIRYTESLDGALRLVPPGWEWSISGGPNTVPSASLTRGGEHQDDEQIDSDGATPIIALCIVALKARVALPSQMHHEQAEERPLSRILREGEA